MKTTLSFSDVLDAADALPLQQQEDRVRILKSRMVEQKREDLATAVKEARADYARGEVKTGTVDDLMKDLEQ